VAGKRRGGTGTRRSSVRILSSHPSWPLQQRAESAGTSRAHAQYQPAPSPLVLVAARTRSHFRRLAFGHASAAAHESRGISAGHADLSIHDSALRDHARRARNLGSPAPSYTPGLLGTPSQARIAPMPRYIRVARQRGWLAIRAYWAQFVAHCNKALSEVARQRR